LKGFKKNLFDSSCHQGGYDGPGCRDQIEMGQNSFLSNS
jgi:hypothetical protein